MIRRGAAALLIIAVLAIAVSALALVAPLGPEFAESVWLREGSSLFALGLDRWLGFCSSDLSFRFPLLAATLAMSLLALRLAVKAGRDRLDLLLIGAATALLPMLLFTMPRALPTALIPLFTLLALLCAARNVGAIGWIALIVIGALLQPWFALPPLAAWLGLELARRELRFRLVVRLLLALLLIYGAWKLGASAWTPLPTLPFSKPIAATICTLLIALGLFPAWRPSRGSFPAAARITAATGGIIGVATLAMLIAALRHAPVLFWPSVTVALLIRAAALQTRWLHPALLAVLLLELALLQSAQREARPLPLQAALDAARKSVPSATTIFAGEGISSGTLRHALHRSGLGAGPIKRGVATLELAVASVRGSAPSLAKPELIEAGLVLDRYGIAESGGGTLRWSWHRPLSLEGRAGGRRPNIAIVSIDTLRADHLDCYGYGRSTAPGISRWAERATLYERALCTAPATGPSFASILSGRNTTAHGLRSNFDFLLPGVWTLPSLLATLGYDSAGFVSSNVLARGGRGLEQNFALYDDERPSGDPARPRYRVRLAPQLAQAANGWLDRHDRSRPFFLWLHAVDPHGPYTPLPEFAGRFRSGKSQLVPRSVILEYQYQNSLDFYFYFDRYDDEIAQTDASIAPLLERLSRDDTERGTIVIFVADHGEAFGEHGLYFQHDGTLHSEELHVPLAIYDTRAPHAARISTPVSTLDIVPTLLDALRVETDLPLDGMSLARRVAEQAPVGTVYRPGQAFIEAGGRRLLADEFAPGGPKFEQYELKLDPLETKPQAATDQTLMRALVALLARDPLRAGGGKRLAQEQWGQRSKEELEALKSLGYVGP